MKTMLSFLLTLAVVPLSLAQIRFEKAYFINNENQRVECFIRNVDWKNNPKKFQYKLTEDAEPATADISNVSEFGIYDQAKYIRSRVKIDTSGTDMSSLSDSPLPEFSEEQVFLKVLVEGSASLYLFEKKNLTRFFYKTGDAPIEQLINKEYYIDVNHVGRNAGYRVQLYTRVNCRNVSLASMEHLNYYKGELERYFINHNECKEGIAEQPKPRKNIFHMRITPGMSYSGLHMLNYGTGFELPYERKLSFRIGLQTEATIPFNRNKWSVVFEPSFNYFHSSSVTDSAIGRINHKFIEFPLGLRHYFFLNENLKLFLNAFFVSNFTIKLGSQLNIDNRTNGDSYPLEIHPSPSFALGAGIEYKRYSAEIRYSTRSNLTNAYWYWYSHLTRLSLVLGFKIF